MSKRSLLVGLILFALGSRAVADTLEVQVFPLSGEIRFRNPNVAAVPFAFYSIMSSTNHIGALNPTNPTWRSITDFYDASGNGFIDATHEWTKIAFSTTELAEGVFVPNTFGSLPGLRSVSLGSIWNPGVVSYTDLLFDIHQDPAAVTLSIQPMVAGDYNHNGRVDQADYTVWRKNLNSTTSLDADGNINGVVDTADYAIWRSNFGNSWPGAGTSSGGGLSLGLMGSAVPEPTSALLILLAGPPFLLGRRRRRVA